MDTQHETGCLLGVHDDKHLSARRKFRILLFHVLYAADAYDYDIKPEDIVHGLNTEYNAHISADSDIMPYAEGIIKHRDHLDTTILPFLENWKINRIGKCTLLTLRIAAWEMLYTQTPHQVIINEAIELAKLFAEKDAYRFVNGVLDKVSTKLDPEQMTKKKLSESPTTK